MVARSPHRRLAHSAYPNPQTADTFRREPNPGEGERFFRLLGLDRHLNWDHREIQDWYRGMKADALRKAYAVEGFQPDLSYKDNVEEDSTVGEAIQDKFQRCIQQHLNLREIPITAVRRVTRAYLKSRIRGRLSRRKNRNEANTAEALETMEPESQHTDSIPLQFEWPRPAPDNEQTAHRLIIPPLATATRTPAAPFNFPFSDTNFQFQYTSTMSARNSGVPDPPANFPAIHQRPTEDDLRFQKNNSAARTGRPPTVSNFAARGAPTSEFSDLRSDLNPPESPLGQIANVDGDLYEDEPTWIIGKTPIFGPPIQQQRQNPASTTNDTPEPHVWYSKAFPPPAPLPRPEPTFTMPFETQVQRLDPAMTIQEHPSGSEPHFEIPFDDPELVQCPKCSHEFYPLENTQEIQESARGDTL